MLGITQELKGLCHLMVCEYWSANWQLTQRVTIKFLSVAERLHASAVEALEWFASLTNSTVESKCEWMAPFCHRIFIGQSVKRIKNPCISNSFIITVEVAFHKGNFSIAVICYNEKYIKNLEIYVPYLEHHHQWISFICHFDTLCRAFLSFVIQPTNAQC